MAFSVIEKEFADALKSVARNLELKELIQQSSELYPLLWFETWGMHADKSTKKGWTSTDRFKRSQKVDHIKNN